MLLDEQIQDPQYPNHQDEEANKQCQLVILEDFYFIYFVFLEFPSVPLWINQASFLYRPERFPGDSEVFVFDCSWWKRECFDCPWCRSDWDRNRSSWRFGKPDTVCQSLVRIHTRTLKINFQYSYNLVHGPLMLKPLVLIGWLGCLRSHKFCWKITYQAFLCVQCCRIVCYNSKCELWGDGYPISDTPIASWKYTSPIGKDSLP